MSERGGKNNFRNPSLSQEAIPPGLEECFALIFIVWLIFVLLSGPPTSFTERHKCLGHKGLPSFRMKKKTYIKFQIISLKNLTLRLDY